MISYWDSAHSQLNVPTPDNIAAIKDAVWVDLYCPTKEEETQVEELLGFELPTPEKRREIEFSSRFYKEDNNIFMTAMMIANSQSDKPSYDPVSFILTEHQLITLRYIDPQAIRVFLQRVKKINEKNFNPIYLLIVLLESSVDRLADTLEWVSRHLDEFSQKVLSKASRSKTIHVKIDYQAFLKQIGTNGDLNSRVRESLVSFNRLLVFLGQSTNATLSAEVQSKISILAEDMRSLNEYVTFLSGKVNFLLEATLGLVTIEQNNIIKIFSIAAVIFLPPTLIASVYGMNFQHMPELAWRWGYPLAIGILLISAWLPYKFFKMKKWL